MSDNPINLKKLPKGVWIAAIAGGGIIGIILYVRSPQPETPDTQVSDSASPVPYGDEFNSTPTDIGTAPPPEYWDYLSTYATVMAPSATHDPPPPPPKIQVSVKKGPKGRTTQSRFTIVGKSDTGQSSIDLIKALKLGAGGAPKGKVVKSNGHPTHKKNKKHARASKKNPHKVAA
jgi:hypothetical protein